MPTKSSKEKKKDVLKKPKPVPKEIKTKPLPEKSHTLTELEKRLKARRDAAQARKNPKT